MSSALSRRRLEAAALLGPLLVFLALLLGFPLAADLVYSLSEVDFATLRAPVWAGLDNYAAVLTSPAFWGSLGFSLRFAVVTTLVEVALGLALALALEPLIARRRWLLAPLLLPMMLSPALIGVMWRLLLNEFVGPVPQYLLALGLDVNLLGPAWVTTTLVAIEVLQWTPFAFLILLTALQAIPSEVLEAAMIDGATAGQRLRRIILPLMLPALLITAFLRFLDGFRVFDHIYVLTGGGPGSLTTSASIFVYRSFFQQDRLGEAIAGAVVLFLLTVGALLLTMRWTLRGSRP